MGLSLRVEHTKNSMIGEKHPFSGIAHTKQAENILPTFQGASAVPNSSSTFQIAVAVPARILINRTSIERARTMVFMIAYPSWHNIGIAST